MEKILFVIVASIAVLVFRRALKARRREALLLRGLIIQRDKFFLSQEHQFYSTRIFSVEDILLVLDMTDFKENHIELISLTENGNGVFKINNPFYHFGESYGLAILELDFENGEKCYSLSIEQTYNCDRSNLENSFNFLLTQVERTVKQLDGEVEVSRRTVSYEVSKL